MGTSPEKARKKRNSPEGAQVDLGTEASMLVLTRKSNQSIMIGDEIEVSVLAIMGEKVRIGIEAPRSIPVFRKEVYLDIQQDTAESAAEARQKVDEALDELKAGESSKPAKGE
jgi:carbon storage regulator